MNSIPIFDSLVHPTLNGQWIAPGSDDRCAAIEPLIESMHASNIQWAFAPGMEGIGAYEEEAYVHMVERFAGMLLPVAFYPAGRMADSRHVAQWVRRVRDLGYRGVKIHPRIAQLRIDHPLLPELIARCNEENLMPMLCTYLYSTTPGSSRNTIDGLARLLEAIGSNRIILLHGGAVRLMEMIEIARAFTNVLLDLSFTLCKYEGSSVDLDIRYAFERFDRRICIGSDHPNFTPGELRRRFEHFADGLDEQKKMNIAHRNIRRFIDDEHHAAQPQ